MPSSSSSPSIFDKLSQKGTVASKQRDAEERETRLKNEQRRQMKTAALTPTKNDRKLKAMQRSPVPQDRIKKKLISSPKQKDELFDRLAKQETFASAAHHIDKASQDNNSVGGCHQLTNSPIRTDRELAATFNRLYKQDTACSRAHQYHKPVDKSLSPKKKITPSPPPSLLQRRLDYKAPGPLIPLKMDVYIRTTEEKKRGTSYNTLDLEQNDLRKQINLYATSKISARALAYDIINALFHRGFTPGRHWKISPATLEELDTRLDDILMKNGEEDGDNIEVFVGMKEAILDYKDLYSVAKLSAKIMISRAGVYVDEYSYFNLNNEVEGKDLDLKKNALDAKKQEEADFRRIKDERAAVKRAEEAAAAKAEAKRRAIEEAEAAKKAQEERAAVKKAQEAAEAEARKRAIVEAEAAMKAEEERAAAAAKKAQEEAAAEAAAKKAQEAAEAEARKREERAAAAAKKAQEEAAAAAEAEARRRAIEAAEATRKEEEEAAAAAKKAQEEAAAAVATENKQVEEDVEAAKKYEDEATVASD
mmetsp:Transcript_4569/g.9470  ORF Transcript_4569/g.9470 Transcript_4569/m.9470 type:complete len:535 (+) Transcript_4569:101-1705(+)